MLPFRKEPILNRISRGLYSMNGKPTQTGENLVVAVHPFYRSPDYKSPHDEFLDGGYLTRLNEFLASREGPVITLEESSRIGRTLQHYDSLGRINNRFFIKTKSGESTPLEISWEMLLDYLINLRDGNPIEMMGGYVWGDEKFGRLSGCLGSVASRLKEKEIPLSFLDNLVFID